MYRTVSMFTLVLALGFPFLAQAQFMTKCEPWLQAKVSVGAPCEISKRSNQDFRGGSRELTVNKDAFFGVTDWVHKTTLEDKNTTGKTGFINVPSLLAMYLDGSKNSEFLLVFKGPSLNNIVGFKLLPNTPSITWWSPFKHHKKANKFMDVSHVSLYARVTEIVITEDESNVMIEVPLQGGVVFLGLILLGLYHRKTRC